MDTKNLTPRPFMFIGSSAEGLPFAEAVQANLEFECECQIWSQGVFGLGTGTLETLITQAERFDFATLVLTPDDLTSSRGQQNHSPRDNVVFELGLFLGKIGKERTFVVLDREAKLKLPSDLSGVTCAAFQKPTQGTLQSALGAACTQIKIAVKHLGSRRTPTIHAFWWSCCKADGVTDDPNLRMTLINRSGKSIPWINVHIFPSNTFQLTPVTPKKDELHPDQYSMFMFEIVNSDGKLTEFANRFYSIPKEELSIRAFKEHSSADAVLISYELGAELHDRIQRVLRGEFGLITL